MSYSVISISLFSSNLSHIQDPVDEEQQFKPCNFQLRRNETFQSKSPILIGKKKQVSNFMDSVVFISCCY
ncbi:hypothetical protein RchiOBHm_Chr6g0280771 [Rosa chinensis]|uniref:Uncharacterized protein n=1 Tax=Rosa chinensis TaxID=74649 RepID=A0A2P6PTB3_ROSCH|nr:hypothetical protein RchiOBHm_Chr6g0280771 [Rosa chinensis]